MLRFVGIVALFVLAACNQSAVKTVASPSPVIAQGNWTQNLTFSGELAGQMSAIVPDTSDQRSECTGARTHNGEPWSDHFYGTLDTAGKQWGVVFLINNFRGPGTYINGDVEVQLHNVENSQVWLNLNGDKVTLTVERSQQAGTIDAQLTSAMTGKNGVERIAGRWNCRG
jgi:hypothetical protein